ncbi:MAG: hypothetical protein Q9221_002631 [Calogaya cf. arnoldii]
MAASPQQQEPINCPAPFDMGDDSVPTKKTETEWAAYKSYDAVLRLNKATIKDDNVDYPGLLDAKAKHLIPGLVRLHGYEFTLLLLAHPAIVTVVADYDGGRSSRTNINRGHVVTE